MAIKFILATTILLTPLAIPAQDHHIPQDARQYTPKSNRKVEVYDFSGDYSQLEVVEIDAKRKQFVDVNLTGNYPLLEEITVNGSFGVVKANLTGYFPKTENVNILCGSASIDLNLVGQWERSCVVNVHSSSGEIHLRLPQDVGVVVHTTKNFAEGDIINHSLIKEGWGFKKKTYFNEQFKQKNPVTLEIFAQITKGKIILD